MDDDQRALQRAARLIAVARALQPGSAERGEAMRTAARAIGEGLGAAGVESLVLHLMLGNEVVSLVPNGKPVA